MSFGDEAEPELPAADAPLAAWSDFAEAVRARLEAGARAYGATTLRRPLPELAGEVMQELEDVAGWSVCLWTRLRAVRERLAMEPRAPLARFPVPDAPRVHPDSENASMESVERAGPSAGSRGDSSDGRKERVFPISVELTRDELRMLGELVRAFGMTPSEALAFSVLVTWGQHQRSTPEGAAP